MHDMSNVESKEECAPRIRVISALHCSAAPAAPARTVCATSWLATLIWKISSVSGKVLSTSKVLVDY